MSLIKSISGIRGTVGGAPGQGFTPVDVVSFTAAYARWISRASAPVNGYRYRVAVGRDARRSGPLFQAIVNNTLLLSGMDVIDLGLATTPTVEMAVIQMKADGGIILTASHNPGQWNALKLINSKGEFLNEQDGLELLSISDSADFCFAGIEKTGAYFRRDYLRDHINSILEMPLVDIAAIKAAGFRIAVDAVNSVGGIAVPQLLKALGVQEIICINCDPDGNFAHNPEPLPENLTELSAKVIETGSGLGIAVDPDVDRLALICEDGKAFGEEYTLVAVADYVLGHNPGNTVSNLSSSRALSDITAKHGANHYASAVGEINVVQMMKDNSAVIGGEGNGGVIYPALHYGRDALAGIALFLSFLAKKGIKASDLRRQYPDYYISKNKIELKEGVSPDDIIRHLYKKYAEFKPDLTDGIRIDFPGSWVHLRKSNTEPILRVYSEAGTREESEKLAREVMGEIL